MLKFYASSLTNLRPHLVPGCKVITGQVAPNSSNSAAMPAVNPFRSSYGDPGMDQGDQYIHQQSFVISSSSAGTFGWESDYSHLYLEVIN